MHNLSPRKIQLEACLFDSDLDFNDLIQLLFLCDSKGVSVISVPSSLLSYKQRFTINAKPACLIDFPLGMSSLRSRISSCLDAINNGAEILDICCNPFYIINLQKSKLEQDIRSAIALGKERGIQIRYILNHRNYSPSDYLRYCSLLYDCGVEYLINHDGMSVDDPTDNLIVADEVMRNINLNVIPSSMMFETQHLDLLENTKITSLRVCSKKIGRFLAPQGV